MNNSKLLNCDLKNVKNQKQSEYDKSKILQNEIDKSNLNLIDTSSSFFLPTNSIFQNNFHNSMVYDNEHYMSLSQSHIAHIPYKDNDDTLNYLIGDDVSETSNFYGLSKDKENIVKVKKIELYEHMNDGRISSRSRSELSCNNKESDEGDLGVKNKVVKNIFNTDCGIRGIDNKGISQQLIQTFNNYGHCGSDRDKEKDRFSSK